MSKYNCQFCTKNVFDCHINRSGFVAFVKLTCPHSQQAMKTIINLHKKKGYNYKIYDINEDSCKGLIKVLKMYLKTNHFTVPQIFFNGDYIGGNSDLQKIKEII